MALRKLILVFSAAVGTAQAATPEEEKKFHAVVGLMYAIKQNLRNPDSVVWENALVSRDGKAVCIQYRAQNGFGGMARQVAIVTDKSASENPSFWNKHCLKNMDDFIYARNAVK